MYEHHGGLVTRLVDCMLDVPVHDIQDLSFVRDEAKTVLKEKEERRKIDRK